jgi:hypothetical protein
MGIFFYPLHASLEPVPVSLTNSQSEDFHML